MIKKPLQIEKTPKTRAFLFFHAKNAILAKGNQLFSDPIREGWRVYSS
tara:strand:+ start:38 stop:181 length:144 start_codon:yes stop_codon:yes gene_type:complete